LIFSFFYVNIREYILRKKREGDFMRQFTIELDEMVCKWLTHIAEISGKPIEQIIADGVTNQVIQVEDSVFQSFAHTEE